MAKKKTAKKAKAKAEAKKKKLAAEAEENKEGAGGDDLDDVLDELVDDGEGEGNEEETEGEGEGEAAGEGEDEEGQEEEEGEDEQGDGEGEGEGEGEDGPPEAVTPVDVETIPVAAITKTADSNTREIIKGDAFDALVGSVANAGVIQPIHVKRVGKTKFQLVAGKRRLAAAKKVGMEYVPAVIVKKEAVNPEYISAIENLMRLDLNPIEEARGMKVLMDDHNHTQEELAKMLGVSQAHISQKLALLDMPKKIQKQLLNGEISEHQARKLMKGESASGSKINVPEDVLPEDVTVSIKGDKATLKIKVYFEEGEKNFGAAIVEDVTEKMQEISTTKFDKAVKAVERES